MDCVVMTVESGIETGFFFSSKRIDSTQFQNDVLRVDQSRARLSLLDSIAKKLLLLFPLSHRFFLDTALS
jgi:hypothetical protein